MRGFEIAELANFDRDQLAAYEESLMAYRDLKGAFDTSYEEGIQEGIEKGRKEGEKNKAVEIAKKMKKRGSDIDFIAETTGLSREEIDKLADKG